MHTWNRPSPIDQRNHMPNERYIEIASNEKSSTRNENEN